MFVSSLRQSMPFFSSTENILVFSFRAQPSPCLIPRLYMGCHGSSMPPWFLATLSLFRPPRCRLVLSFGSPPLRLFRVLDCNHPPRLFCALRSLCNRYWSVQYSLRPSVISTPPIFPFFLAPCTHSRFFDQRFLSLNVWGLLLS